MESWKQFEGQYHLQETQVTVKIINGRLTSSFPGVPPGFEIILEPLAEPTHFRMKGGPADGTTAVFHLDETGQVTTIVVGGEHEFSRRNGLVVQPRTATGQGLIAPELLMDAEKESAFAELLQDVLSWSDGRVLDYTLPYPKHEFLQYVALQEIVIFHGSGKADIAEFQTRRTSMELKDKSGRGNVQGIYGTHDGLWPLFFAIVDREKITGSIRNGFSTFQNDAGEQIRVYHFSINQDWLASQPWRSGTLYLLPRETFKRMPISVEGGESNEWVSKVPVRPFARLTVAPEDFPFLPDIGGHDDSELIRMGELGDEVITAVTEAMITPEKISMKLNYTAELGTLLLAYIPLAQNFIPAAHYTLRFEPEEQVWYDVAAPPAVMQVLKDRLENHLDKQNEPSSASASYVKAQK